MSYCIISYITDGVQYFIKGLIFLIVRTFLYCITEIIKGILIMTAVYAIAQLIYIAWVRFVENRIFAELQSLSNITKLRAINNRCANTRSCKSPRESDISAITENDIQDGNNPRTTEKDTQTAPEFMPVDDNFVKSKGRLTRITFQSDLQNTNENLSKAETETPRESSVESVDHFVAKDKIKLFVPRPSKRVTLIEDNIETQAIDHEDNDINKTHTMVKRKPSTNEGTSDNQYRRVQRRRKKKRMPPTYNIQKNFDGSSSSDDEASETYPKHRNSTKKPEKNSSIDEENGEEINIPVRVSNYLKTPMGPQEAEVSHANNSTMPHESVQYDERQINKKVYSRRSTTHRNTNNFI